MLTPMRLLVCLLAIAIPVGLLWPIEGDKPVKSPCPVVGTFASACALLNHGHDAAALKQTQKLLVANPTVKPPVALEELAAKTPKSSRERIREAVADWAPIVLWALTALVAAWVLGREVWRWLGSRERPHLVIEAFTGGEASDNSALATGFSRELQARIERVDETGGPRVDLSQPGSTGPLEAAVTSPIPQMNIIAGFIALLRGLVPSNDVRLTGHLHPATGQGVGVSLALARQDGRIIDQVMLREASYGPEPLPTTAVTGVGFEALALAASAWTRQVIDSKRRNAEPHQPDWRATALFAAGALWQERADPRTAKRLYYAALRLEPNLVGALANLGRIETREGLSRLDLDLFARGRARILRARELSAS